MTKQYFQKHSQTHQLSIPSLKLDPLNPRITPGHDIYEWMAQHEKILPLAKDIAEFGLNGMNNLGAFLDEEDIRYIVLEGNRRLCALHFLLNPSLCPKTKLHKAFQKLSQKTNAPEILKKMKIDVAVYENREIAKHFLRQLHKGSNNGMGRIPWNAVAQSRFDAMDSPYTLAYMVLEYTLAQAIEIPQDKDKNITTLQRYLGNTEVQNILGLFVNKKTKSLESTRPIKEIDQIIEQLILDLNNKTLSSRSNKDDQIQYAKDLIQKFKLKEPEEQSKKESFFHLPEILTKEEEEFQSRK